MPGEDAGGYRPPWPHPQMPGPGYPQPPLYAFGGPPAAPRNEFGTTSLVLGVIALLASWVPFGGLILGICALATGVAARARAKRGEATNAGTATAGMVLGIVATIIGAVITLWMLYTIISYQECIGHAVGRYEYSQCG